MKQEATPKQLEKGKGSKKRKLDPEAEDDNKTITQQYFAFLVSLNCSDIEFGYKFYKYLENIKKLDEDPVLILCGTSGGVCYGNSFHIKKTVKFDRGQLLALNPPEIKWEEQKEAYFQYSNDNTTAYCSNYLMQFVWGANDKEKMNHVMDMETFEFNKICENMKVTTFSAVRIISDMPQLDFGEANEFVKKLDLKIFGEYPFLVGETKGGLQKEQRLNQRKLLRKILDFSTAVCKVEELLSIFTDSKILPTPSNQYFHGEKGRQQDKFVLRQINKDVMFVYNFPLKDNAYFDYQGKGLEFLIENIKDKQKKYLEGYVTQSTSATIFN